MAETTEAKKTILVTSKVYAKIKEWTGAGRTVNRFVCQDLGCLGEYFSPNPECSCPGHVWNCPGRIETADVKLADLKAEAVVAKPITVKDIRCFWRESNQMSIVIEVPTHWRPIKVVSFGYLCEMERGDRGAILRENGRRWPSKWFKAAVADGSLETILNQYGATLEPEPKVLEG